jgi:anti-sigma28 factor (negative regulator of flagellin synthesis)
MVPGSNLGYYAVLPNFHIATLAGAVPASRQRIPTPLMSIRIQSDGIGAAATSQTAPAEKTGKPDSTSSGSIGNSGADQVDISSLSGSIASASSALASQQSARVSQLTALYASGQFQVNSAHLSQALVTSAMGGLVGGDY